MKIKTDSWLYQLEVVESGEVIKLGDPRTYQSVINDILTIAQQHKHTERDGTYLLSRKSENYLRVKYNLKG